MIISAIQGRRADLTEDELAALTEVRVPVTDLQRVTRVQRLTADTGEEFGLRLPEVRELHDGDVLHRDAERLVTVQVLPTDVLVIRPGSVLEMGRVAHALGNRHLQAQFFGPGEAGDDQTVMVVRYDHTVEHHLDHVGVAYSREERVMPHAFRHAEHTH